MAAERLAQLNERLENPPVADVAVSRHMGLFAVAHLAARHRIRVRLRPPARPADPPLRYALPGTLTSRDSAPATGRGRAPARGPRGPRPPPRHPRPPLASGSRAARHRRWHGGPIPRAAPTRSSRRPSRPGQGALPIFDAVESDWFRARGRGRAAGGEPRTGSAAPAGRDPGHRRVTTAGGSPPRPSRPAVQRATTAGLPRRMPQANLVPGSAGDREPRQATWPRAAGDSAQPAGRFPARLPPGPRRTLTRTPEPVPGGSHGQ